MRVLVILAKERLERDERDLQEKRRKEGIRNSKSSLENFKIRISVARNQLQEEKSKTSVEKAIRELPKQPSPPRHNLRATSIIEYRKGLEGSGQPLSKGGAMEEVSEKKTKLMKHGGRQEIVRSRRSWRKLERIFRKTMRKSAIPRENCGLRTEFETIEFTARAARDELREARARKRKSV